MTIADWLKVAKRKLEESEIETSALDSEILICNLLKKDRSWVHANTHEILNTKKINTLNSQIQRRTDHEPIAYILGKQEFYGREFLVSPDTLTPRPETETMIELLIKQLEDNTLKAKESLKIIDAGTGSGCIIITAALELTKIQYLRSKIQFTGLEISKPALQLARQNAKKLGADIDFQKFDLTKEPLNLDPSAFNIILANLPYVPRDFKINLAASHEPEFAIYGGEDGLDYYRELFKKAKNTQLILTESLPPQHEEMAKIAASNDYKLMRTLDLIQVFEPA